MLSLLLFVLSLSIIIGIPIAFSIAGSSAIALMYWDFSLLKIIAHRMFEGVNSFVIVALPLFILAGNIMSKAKITDSLINFSYMTIGRIPGSTSHVNVLVSMLFAGISGSAVADTSALGSVLIPGMVKEGYDSDYSAAITAASSIIGPIIPPSIIMVIYSLATGVSIGALFIAGVIPGILIGLSLLILGYYISIKRNYPKKKEKTTLILWFGSFKKAIIPLIMPIIIIGGILLGVFTPTESASIAVIYGLFVGLFVLKTIKLIDLYSIIVDSAVTTGVVFLILGASSALSWILTTQQVPQLISLFFQSITKNVYIFLFLMNLLFLLIGCFLDAGPAILILAPIFSPVAISYGINPLHFALIMIVNLTIGLATPPVGSCLYIACEISNNSLEQVSKAILPFIIIEIIVLGLITYFPFFTLYLPKLLGFI